MGKVCADVSGPPKIRPVSRLSSLIGTSHDNRSWDRATGSENFIHQSILSDRLLKWPVESKSERWACKIRLMISNVPINLQPHFLGTSGLGRSGHRRLLSPNKALQSTRDIRVGHCWQVKYLKCSPFAWTQSCESVWKYTKTKQKSTSPFRLYCC